MGKVIAFHREGFLTILEAYLPKESIGVEIGVLNGDFSERILQRIKPKRLYLIDPYETGGNKYESGLTTAYSTEFDYEKILERFKSEISTQQVTLFRNYSHDIVHKFKNNLFDFIYIDSSHLYEDVKKDLEDWLPKLKTNGYMCGHDYVEIENFGVILAVDEFIVKHGFEWVALNENGGDWMLKRKV